MGRSIALALVVVLLAIGAPQKPFADGSSSVAAFSIGTDHGLKFLGEASVGGKGACHLAVDASQSAHVSDHDDAAVLRQALDRRVPVDDAEGDRSADGHAAPPAPRRADVRSCTMSTTART